MKKSINVMLTGLLLVPAIALLSTTFSPALQTVGAQADSDCVPSATQTCSPSQGASSAQGNSQSNDLFGDEGIFKIVTNTALFVIGAISVLMLIYGGILYTISGGESTKVTNAKNTILYAVVGIVVAILAFAIVNFVLGTLVKT